MDAVAAVRYVKSGKRAGEKWCYRCRPVCGVYYR